MKKKFLSFALAATMVLGSISSVFAEETKNEPKVAAFMIEATDGVSYCTATSDGDIWGANGKAETHKDASVYEGNEYAVTMSRIGNSFEVVFENNATGEQIFDTLKLTDTDEFSAKDTVVYIGAQVGDFDVTVEVKEKNNPSASINPSVNPSADPRNDSDPQNVKGIAWWAPENERTDAVAIADGEVITFLVKVNETKTADDNNGTGSGDGNGTGSGGTTTDDKSAVTVSADAVKAIAAAVKVLSSDGKELNAEITVSAVEDTKVAEGLVAENEDLQKAKVSQFAVLDLKLSVDGKNVTLLDGKISVNVPADKIFKDIKADASVAVYRIDKVNDKEQLSYLGISKVAADKTITFATEHFSQYVFAVVENAEALKDVKVVDYTKDIDTKATPDVKVSDIKVETPEESTSKDASLEGGKPGTGDSSPVMPLVVLAVVALGAVVAVVASKKRA